MVTYLGVIPNDVANEVAGTKSAHARFKILEDLYEDHLQMVVDVDTDAWVSTQATDTPVWAFAHYLRHLSESTSPTVHHRDLDFILEALNSHMVPEKYHRVPAHV